MKIERLSVGAAGGESGLSSQIMSASVIRIVLHNLVVPKAGYRLGPLLSVSAAAICEEQLEHMVPPLLWHMPVRP